MGKGCKRLDHLHNEAGPSKRCAARERPRTSPDRKDYPKKVLLIEDAVLISKIITRSIVSTLGHTVQPAFSYAEAAAILEDRADEFSAAVTDLDLPDAPLGEVVDLTVKCGLPTIVLTATFCDATRAKILARDIVDYHVKGIQGLAGINRSLKRLERNPTMKVLVVDDSRTVRAMIRKLLDVHLFEVIEAGDGVEGFEILERNPDVTLVITDCEMPKMNGIEMTKRIRAKRAQDDLAVIGISALGTDVSARFLKNGANDYLSKPFQKEEFYCRLYRCIETQEHIKEIKRAAYTDKLTGLHNRLYFFKKAPPLYETVIREEIPFAVAMMDIDFFKSINDTFGHAGGDLALVRAASILRDNLPDEALLTRFGGEEFCCFLPGMDRAQAIRVFERLRRAVAATKIPFNGETISFTISIGLSVSREETIDEAINRADGLLYMSKDGGRNRITIDREPATQSTDIVTVHH